MKQRIDFPSVRSFHLESSLPVSADYIIDKLELSPHPEGGYFRETFRDPDLKDYRSVGTAIYFLLKEGQVSRWHQVDASEIWHHYAGSPLKLGIADGVGDSIDVILGGDIESGQLPQFVVPKNFWQQAQSLGEWTLVGCTVSPGFEFSGFHMAPEGWEPGSDQ